MRSEPARRFFERWVPALWETAVVPAILLPATITLLSNLHHSIPTDGSLWFCNPKLFMNIYFKYTALPNYDISDQLCVSYLIMLHKFKLCKNEWLGSLPMMNSQRQDLSWNTVKISDGRTEKNGLFLLLFNGHFSTTEVTKAQLLIHDIISHICHNRFEYSIQLKIHVYSQEHCFQGCMR